MIAQFVYKILRIKTIIKGNKLYYSVIIIIILNVWNNGLHLTQHVQCVEGICYQGYNNKFLFDLFIFMCFYLQLDI